MLTHGNRTRRVVSVAVVTVLAAAVALLLTKGIVETVAVAAVAMAVSRYVLR